MYRLQKILKSQRAQTQLTTLIIQQIRQNKTTQKLNEIKKAATIRRLLPLKAEKQSRFRIQS